MEADKNVKLNLFLQTIWHFFVKPKFKAQYLLNVFNYNKIRCSQIIMFTENPAVVEWRLEGSCCQAGILIEVLPNCWTENPDIRTHVRFAFLIHLVKVRHKTVTSLQQSLTSNNVIGNISTNVVNFSLLLLLSPSYLSFAWKSGARAHSWKINICNMVPFVAKRTANGTGHIHKSR